MLRDFCGRTGEGAKRWIHHANVAGTQAGRDSRLLQFLKQAVVELLVGVGIMLEDVVLDQFFGQIIRLRFLLIERVLQKLNVAARGVVFLLDSLRQQSFRARV